MKNSNIYDLGDFNTQQVRTIVRTLKDVGSDPTPVLWRRPDAADDVAAFAKSMPMKEMSGIVPDAFAGTLGITLLQSLSLMQLQEIGARGDGYLKQAALFALDGALAKNPSDPRLLEIREYVDTSPAWQR